MHNNNQKEQPRIEILGDHTVLYYADGRTSVLRGTSRQEVISSPQRALVAAALPPRDKLTRALALGLTLYSGTRAVLQLGRGWLPGVRRAMADGVVSQLMRSITLRAYRRPLKAPRNERDNAGPSAAAYSRAEITAG